MNADPYARRDQMFPRLSAAQMARAASAGHQRDLRDGEILFEQGTPSPSFFVVVTGEVAIVQDACEREQTVTIHGPGEFTGEVDLLTGRPSLVRAVARGAGRVVEIDRAALRTIVQTDAEMSELLMRAFILRRVGLIAHNQSDVLLVSSPHVPGTLELREFLTRNGHPFAFVDVDVDQDIEAMMHHFQITPRDLPVVMVKGRALRSPSLPELANVLGIAQTLDARTVYDVAIVGAGPAGLAAAVYAASEGLSVIVLESVAPGGQAGSSSKIENYLGFPTGISGEALAGRAFTQAQKFGAEIAVTRSAKRLACDCRPYAIELADGARVRGRSVVIASGARYRKPRIAELERFEGRGIYYAATHLEGDLCKGAEVAVVGGGNSAGQAAAFLSDLTKHVHVVVRGQGLAATMSKYLVRRLEESPQVTIHTETEIVRLEGDRVLQRVTLRDKAGRETLMEIPHVFMMTGAIPSTEWLHDCVALDAKGFVKTGADVDKGEAARAGGRAPLLLETSVPGVFAVGDVRANSVKRVASAVGEGAICVQLLHQALAE